MSFIDEIKDLEKERLDKEQEIIEEIVEYFKDIFNKKSYEDYLKGLIKEQINKSQNTLKLNVEFWEYSPGCGATGFRCGGNRFELDYEEYKYKGIRLRDIQEVVGDVLSNTLINKLKELGLKIIYTNRRDDEFRYHYYKNDIVVGWNE